MRSVCPHDERDRVGEDHDMKTVMIFMLGSCVVLGTIGIGAWLVMHEHPGFGFLCILIGATTTLRYKED